ncbi:MAG TPA: hypothetical protein DHV36_04625 [Desulfobacteraceae bacterium]|nr:hypothetical protein [Desulfobacteraceae bacterium]
MIKSAKRYMSKMMAKTANRVDFTRVIERIANSSQGRPHLERYAALPLDWENADDISTLAVDLTMAQLEAEHAPDTTQVERAEIEDLISNIQIRYDRELHLKAAAAVRVVFDHLFDHSANPDLPFTSPDGRDLHHIETLKNYRNDGLGVLYLINHNSHLDEFIFNSLMQDLGLGLPVFAAGQNMMAIESVAKVLMIGSYVVLRKSASRHQLAALYNYCSALSRLGAQQGIFLEAWRGGARTRDGSLRYPKRLVAVRGAIDTDRDLVIQPVALSYSVVPEDLMMCARKSGKTWFNGVSLMKTLLNFPLHPRTCLWRASENLYSRCRVSFPEPMLLSTLKGQWQQDKRGTEFDEFVALNAITQIARTKKIMASQLTARALTNAKRNHQADLDKAAEEEMATIKAYHAQHFRQPPDFEDFILNNDTTAIVNDGITTLTKRGILNRWSKDSLKLPAVQDEIGLSYYATHGDRRLYSPTADQNIVVVGAGNWGFALSNLVAQRLLEDKTYDNASITIYDPRKKLVRHMGKERLGPGRFKDMRLKKNVFVTHDTASAFRKASEVIIASKPERFEAQVREIIDTSEQQMKLIIATRGFIPGTTLLPFHLVQNLLLEYRRTDIDVLTLAGPLETDDLVETGKVSGILAGPPQFLREVADLFIKPEDNPFLSTDPIGVQSADILARVYALSVNIMAACTEGKPGVILGRLYAQASDEARSLTLAMGASPDTFTAGSIPWTASFVALAAEGPLKEMGEKLGEAAKKGKKPDSRLNKLKARWQKGTKKIQVLTDMEAALACGEQRGVELSLLRQAYDVVINRQIPPEEE